MKSGIVEHISIGLDRVDGLAIFRALIAGLSTSLGAAIVIALPRGTTVPNEQMAFALALAAGVMLTVSVVEMFLPNLVTEVHRVDTIVWAGIGVLSFLALKWVLPEPHLKDAEDELPPSPRTTEAGGASVAAPTEPRKMRQWRLALLLTIALTAHNFPEGLAVAVSSMESDRLGFVVMLAIAMHNIPEGIAIAMPVLDATGSPMRAMQMATLSGLAEPLGALVALVLLPDHALEARGLDRLLCLVGGIMSCVACVELLPEALAQKRPFYVGAGLLAGFAVMMITHELA